MTLHTCAAAPCKSCPYRQDVPSGVWDESEYEKLPAYDGDMSAQALNGAVALFMCHQRDGRLCAGWVAAHGPHNLLALRFNAARVDPAVFNYQTTTPVFASGQEAYAHGVRDIDAPSAAATRVMRRLVRKQEQAHEG